MDEYKIINQYLRDIFTNSPSAPDAVYLTGSYGRQEGVIKKQNNKISLYNDLDLLVVNWSVTDSEVKHIKEQLKEKFSINWVDIDLVGPEFFHKIKSTCYSVDLKTCSTQIFGAKDFREVMTVQSHAIADMDIRKLYHTRGWCVIGVFGTNFYNRDLNTEDAEFFRYQLVKLIFAGVDIFLITKQSYVSNYRDKIVKAKQLGIDFEAFNLCEEMLLDIKFNSSNAKMNRNEAVEFYKNSVKFFTTQFTLSKGTIRMKSQANKTYSVLDFVTDWLMLKRSIKYILFGNLGQLRAIFNLFLQTLLIQNISSVCRETSSDTEGFYNLQFKAEKVAERRLENKG